MSKPSFRTTALPSSRISALTTALKRTRVGGQVELMGRAFRFHIPCVRTRQCGVAERKNGATRHHVSQPKGSTRVQQSNRSRLQRKSVAFTRIAASTSSGRCSSPSRREPCRRGPCPKRYSAALGHLEPLRTAPLCGTGYALLPRSRLVSGWLSWDRRRSVSRCWRRRAGRFLVKPTSPCTWREKPAPSKGIGGSAWTDLRGRHGPAALAWCGVFDGKCRRGPGFSCEGSCS